MAKPVEIDERQFFMREILEAKKRNEELERHVCELSSRTIELSEMLGKTRCNAIQAEQELACARREILELEIESNERRNAKWNTTNTSKKSKKRPARKRS